MKFNKNILLSAGIIVLSLLSLFIFHKVPVSRIWNKYSVLAVSKQEDESTVLSILENLGCNSIVSLSLQTLPIFSQFSPVQKGSLNGSNSYLSKKNLCFFDKSGQFQLYYIPEEYKNSVEDAYKILVQNYHINAFLDSQSRFPWITPLICILFSLVLFFYSNQRVFFATSAFFPLLFTVSQPFHANAGAVCLLIYSLFFLQNLRRRKNSMKVLIKNKFALMFFLIPLFLSFANSFLGGLLCLLCVCASIAAENILYEIENSKLEKALFKRVLILPAEFIQLKTLKSVRVMLFCMLSLGCLLFIYSGSTRFLPSGFSNDLLLPSPERYNEKDSIVSLNDYIDLNWYLSTYPYISLNSNNENVSPQKGDVVVIPRFEDSPKGIVQTDEIVFRYDDSFVNTVNDQIDSLHDGAFEKMLKKQGSLNAVSYSATGKSEGNIKSLLILIAEFLIPLFGFIFLIKGSKTK